MNRLLAGISTPQIPAIPTGLSIVATGPDPTLSLPAEADGTARRHCHCAGDHRHGPACRQQRTDGSDVGGAYNPRIFSVTAADIKLGTIPNAGSGWQLGAAINPETGEIGISLFSTTPIQFTVGGSLVTITLQVVGSGQWAVGSEEGAAGSNTPISLVEQVDPTRLRIYQTGLADGQGSLVVQTVAGSGRWAVGSEEDSVSGGAEKVGQLLSAHSQVPNAHYFERAFSDAQGMVAVGSLDAAVMSVLLASVEIEPAIWQIDESWLPGEPSAAEGVGTESGQDLQDEQDLFGLTPIIRAID